MSIIDQFRLDGQFAVVTGAQGKLGSLWTKTLLEAGANVAALDLKECPPSQTQQTLLNQYGYNRLQFFEADVTKRDSLEQAFQQIQNSLGSPCILVNNAGIDQPPGQLSHSYLLEHIPQESFSQVLDVNVTGAFLAMQVFGESMLTKGKGSIINIGSLYASVSPNTQLYNHIPIEPPFLKPPAYGASKAALLNLTQYFATHWAPRGVRVNVLSPGGVEGEQDSVFKQKFRERVPMDRMATLEDLVGPFLFLASQASCYVTGINLKVDGGFTLW